MVRYSKSAALFSLVALFGCDKISPFISQEEYDERIDLDQDGVPNVEDCDPNDKTVTRYSFYRDLDGDGFGSIKENQTGCKKVTGLVEKSGDCNDANDKIYPGAVESCDQFDNDCDGSTDESVTTRWFADKDSDTHGNPNVYTDSCDQPSGYVLTSDDCDDEDPTVSPEATEVCDDDVDQNCNGVVDDAENAFLHFIDADGDRFGDPNKSYSSCITVGRFVTNGDDCDDQNSSVNPDATEFCKDEIDNDCDGETDTDSVEIAWYRDADKDGFGNPDDHKFSCSQPDGYVADASDCDDEVSDINPNAEEVCNNGIDDNCDEDVNQCAYQNKTNLADLGTQFTHPEMSIGDSVVAVDLNDDQTDDIAMSGVSVDFDMENVGAVFINFGPFGAGMHDLSDSDSIIVGSTYEEQIGNNLTSCDLLGTQAQDLIIGSVSANSSSGIVYVVQGPVVSGTHSVDTLTTSVLYLSAGTTAQFGRSVSCHTDFDNETTLVVGSNGTDYNGENSGSVFIFKSKIETGKIDAGQTASTRLNCPKAYDECGISVAVGSKMTLVGAYGDDTDGLNSGAVYVISEPIPQGEYSIDQIASSKLTCSHDGDICGLSVAYVGDIDDDGSEDFVVGAPGDDTNGTDSGAVYVISSKIQQGKSTIEEVAISKLVGEIGGDELGRFSNKGFGSIDHDQIDDLLIGCPKSKYKDPSAGSVYYCRGPINPGEYLISNCQVSFGGTAGELAGSSLTILRQNAGMYNSAVATAPGNPTGVAAFIIPGLGL